MIAKGLTLHRQEANTRNRLSQGGFLFQIGKPYPL